MSNPYAPPEDRPRPADGESEAPAGSPPSGPDPRSGSGHPPGEAGPAPQWPAGGAPSGPHHVPAHHPHPMSPQGPAAPVPTDPVGADRARRSARMFGFLLLGGVALSTLPIPAQAVALPFVLAAAVFGIRGLVLASRAHLRGGLVPMLAGGVVITVIWSFAMGAMLMIWPLLSDREDCLAGALTAVAKDQCKQTFENDFDAWRKRATT